MLVPQKRLLTWFAIVALPFSVLGILVPGAGIVAAMLITAMLLAFLLDAIRGLGRLDGLRVEVPEIVRVSRDRTARLDLILRDDQPRRRHLRVGLPWPESIDSPMPEQRLVTPPDGGELRMSWPFRARERGAFQLDRTCLETSSPLGFWAVRSTLPTPAHIRVYPNLLHERRQLAGLFLNRGTLGIHTQRQVGKGREFEKLREYIPGDGFEDIHWKATAKRGHPVTKVFQIERTQEVYVIIDASRLSARPVPVPRREGETEDSGEAVPRHEPILERYLTAALVLGLAAERQGDLFGLMTFSDTVDTFLRAKNGRHHYNACRDALYTVRSRPVSPDFDELATFIRLRLRRRALLLFLTALDDPIQAEGLVKGLDLVSRQHLVLVNMIQPERARPLFTRPDVTHARELYDRLGGHLQWHTLRELEKVLQRRGVAFHLLENEKLSAQLVTHYLGVKRRQLL